MQEVAQHRRSCSWLLLAVSAALLNACSRAPAPTAARHATSHETTAPTSAASSAQPPAPPWVASARAQIGVTRYYVPSYVVLAYPGGDVPRDRGVCTDVVIRAFRAQGVDLQRQVHEDLRRNFARYPRTWGLRGPDRNIDHRRVPNLQRWFERQQWRQAISTDASEYLAGDLVTWDLGGNVPHIGIVSERTRFGIPMIIHNIGNGAREENILFDYRITGHYRPRLPLPTAQ